MVPAQVWGACSLLGNWMQAAHSSSSHMPCLTADPFRVWPWCPSGGECTLMSAGITILGCSAGLRLSQPEWGHCSGVNRSSTSSSAGRLPWPLRIISSHWGPPRIDLEWMMHYFASTGQFLNKNTYHRDETPLVFSLVPDLLIRWLGVSSSRRWE